MLDGATRLKSLVDGPILDLVVKKVKEAPVLPSNLESLREQPLLKKFESMGGVLDLLKAAKAAVKQYKADKLRDMWQLWLGEVEAFSQLPSFFETFSQDREKEAIIYKLVDGSLDLEDQSGQEDLHNDMVKYAYKIVS